MNEKLEKPNKIWIVSLKSTGYGGSSYITESVEKRILDCETNYHKYLQTRKRHFYNRKDAEDYARPIAQEAFKVFLSNWEANLDEDEKPSRTLEKFKQRGFKEIHQDELTENSPYYQLYYSKEPSTIFVCPTEHEYDRIGHNFASISQTTIY